MPAFYILAFIGALLLWYTIVKVIKKIKEHNDNKHNQIR